MKVEAPMWSACTTGRSAVNWGASEGAAAAWCAFHLSTRRLMSSLSTLNSAICASTALKSAMISPFRSARSASAGAASRRRSMSAERALNPASDSSAIRPGLRDRLFENDAFTRREQLRDVEQDDDRRALRLASHERAQVLLGEPLEERRRGRELVRGDGHHFVHRVHDRADPLRSRDDDENAARRARGRRRELEARAQINDRHHATAVVNDPFEPRGNVRDRPRRGEAQDAFDGEDVRGEELLADAEGHDLAALDRRGGRRRRVKRGRPAGLDHPALPAADSLAVARPTSALTHTRPASPPPRHPATQTPRSTPSASAPRGTARTDAGSII